MISSETDGDSFDEYNADYFYNLPIFLQKNNKLNINIDIDVSIMDILNKNKKKN